MKKDVVVLGGGFIGLNAAYHLASQGFSVAIADRYSFLSGASGSSAAMLESQIDAYRGDPFFSLARRSLDLFPTLYRDIKNLTQIDFEFEQCGIYQLAMTEADTQIFKKEVARQKKISLKAHWTPGTDLQKEMPELKAYEHGAIFFEEDGQVNGDLFGRALLEACRKQNVELFENQSGLSLKVERGHVTGVILDTHTIDAGHVVIATGAWANEVLFPLGYQIDIKPMRGQLLLFEPEKRYMKSPVYTQRNGYITPKNTVTMVGSTMEDVGFDQKTTDVAKKDLWAMAQHLVPSLLKTPYKGMSAGLRPATPDGLPYLNKLPEFTNVVLACGHFRNGVLLCPVTAAIIEEIITGRFENVHNEATVLPSHSKQ